MNNFVYSLTKHTAKANNNNMDEIFIYIYTIVWTTQTSGKCYGMMFA